MKKAIMFILILCLAISVGGAYGEDNDAGILFTNILTPIAAKDTALENILSEAQRTVLAVCMLTDLSLDEGFGKEFLSKHLGEFIFNDSYMASDGNFVVLTGYADGKILSIFYIPILKETRYSCHEADLSDELMKYTVKAAAEKLTFSYKNDSILLLKTFNDLLDSIKDT